MVFAVSVPTWFPGDRTAKVPGASQSDTEMGQALAEHPKSQSAGALRWSKIQCIVMLVTGFE